MRSAWLQGVTPSIVAIAVLVAGLASAEPDSTPRPLVEVETDRIMITVWVSPALDPWPALATVLRTEARENAAHLLVESNEKARKLADLGQEPEPRDEIERSYDLYAVIPDRYVSVLVSDSVVPGGAAHGGGGSHGIFWDVAHGRRTDARSLFAETAKAGPTMTALETLVRRGIVAEKQKRGGSGLGSSAVTESTPSLDDLAAQDRWLENVRVNLERASLEPSDQPGRISGLTFHFWSCEVDACAGGGLDAFVPWRELEPFLTKEGASIFGGGRRPTIDEGE